MTEPEDALDTFAAVNARGRNAFDKRLQRLLQRWFPKTIPRNSFVFCFPEPYWLFLGRLDVIPHPGIDLPSPNPNSAAQMNNIELPLEDITRILLNNIIGKTG